MNRAILREADELRASARRLMSAGVAAQVTGDLEQARRLFAEAREMQRRGDGLSPRPPGPTDMESAWKAEARWKRLEDRLAEAERERRR